MADITVATMADLDGLNVGPDQVGASAYVAEVDAWFLAMFEGRGRDKWAPNVVGGRTVQTAGMRGQRIELQWDDPRLEVADVEVAIPAPAPLAAGSVIMGTAVQVIEPFTDGINFATCGFGTDKDPELYAPTGFFSLEFIDNLYDTMALPGTTDPVQLTMRTTGRMADLTQGRLVAWIYYVVPILIPPPPPSGRAIDL